MKVKELMEVLKTIDPEKEIIISTQIYENIQYSNDFEFPLMNEYLFDGQEKFKIFVSV
jgi:hypothetical protein